jgi:dihydrofolate synthase / folylpolyglutamate synthase
VIEVGLGGRLDATNVLTPLVTVCTDISFDHVEILGNTLTKIAGEKAGIIKPGVPHVIGPLPPEATRVMERTCKKQGAPLHSMLDIVSKRDEQKLRLDFRSSNLELRGFQPSLLGVHQLKNATVALHTLSVLKEQGVEISKAAIVRGLRRTAWAARFQILRRTGKPTIVLDVCHNAAGAAAFADTFRKVFPGKKGALVFGVVQRKDHQAMIDSLAPISSEFTLLPLKTRRSMPPKELIAQRDFRGVPVHRIADLGTGYRRLLRRSSSDDILVVAGSHYLVGEFLRKYVKDASA